MREELRQLIELQRLDAAVREVEAAKQRIAREAAQAQDRFRREQQTFQERTQHARSFRKALDLREVDLKENENKIASLQVQLNTVKTNREYSALQHEIMGLKADASRLEDEILTMLEQAEQQQRELKDLERRLQEEEAAVRQRQEDAQRAIQDADQRIARLRQERAALASRIPRDFLSRYERLLHKADGRALAACRDFVCEACRMALTANTVNRLLAGQEIVYCHSCGRILYLAEDQDLGSTARAGRKDLW